MRLMLFIKNSPRITKMGISNRCVDDKSVLATLNQQHPEQYNGHYQLNANFTWRSLSFQCLELPYPAMNCSNFRTIFFGIMLHFLAY
uniref:Uncharacterized protein n=1 Tax=Globodera pallida TaxID=36090 RepID=A0A183C522_GLOPA